MADASLERNDYGRLLVGGSPLRLIRLTSAGAQHVDRWLAGEPVGSEPAERRLASRLLNAAMVHFQPYGQPHGQANDTSSPSQRVGQPRAQHLWSSRLIADTTVVVPVLDDASGLHDLLYGLANNPHEPGDGTVVPVIVVDDGSANPDAIAAVADEFRASVVRRPVNGGPGAARNTGLAKVTTPVAVFVDADVTVSASAIDILLGHFADPKTAAAAPRVRSRTGSSSPGVVSRSESSSVGLRVRSRVGSSLSAAIGRSESSLGGLRVRSRAGSSLLERYESLYSPLDLGGQPSPVGPHRRLSYVPAAVLAVRTEAARRIGGFDESLRWGEDVDLVLRLAEAGYAVRYEPAATASHRPRSSWRAWLRQRRCYGASAAPLARRHRDSVIPARCSWPVFCAWAAVAMGLPATGVAIALTSGTRSAARIQSAVRRLSSDHVLSAPRGLSSDRVLSSARRLSSDRVLSSARGLSSDRVLSSARGLSAARRSSIPVRGLLSGCVQSSARRLPVSGVQRFEGWLLAVRLVARAHLLSGLGLARAVPRTWWPLLLPLSLLHRKLRATLVAALLLPALWDWWQHRQGPLGPATTVALRAVDDIAYSLGVWQGMIAHRCFEPLRPQLRSFSTDRERSQRKPAES